MRKITGIFIVVMVLVIAAYDIWVIAEHGKAASISWVIIEWAHAHPSIPFLSGYLCGHLFWRMRDPG